jgi:hypothetical protein
LSSSPPTANTKVRKPFTRSSAPKEVVEEQSLPKASTLQKKKGKGIVNLVEKKEETHVQKKKDKGKGIKKPDEIDKAIPMQQEEETMKNPVETVHVTTPPDSQTFKRLIRKLRDARKEVAQLKVEAMSNRVKMKELMDGYNHTLNLVRFAARKAQPLHRQLKKLYRQNRGFQSQNKKLKAELQHFQDEVGQRNLQVLVEDAIEKETPTTKESISPLKKHVTSKRKNPIVPKEDPPSPRKSVRLTK